MSIKFLLDENIPYALIYLLFISHDIAGIILIKLTMTNTSYLLRKMEAFFDKYEDKLSEKHLIIVEDETIRIY